MAETAQNVLLEEISSRPERCPGYHKALTDVLAAALQAVKRGDAKTVQKADLTKAVEGLANRIAVEG